MSGTLRLDEWLIENPEATFMLKPSSNAMIGAGIVSSDLVLLDRSRTPKDGDIVLAEVDDTRVMRYFRKRGSRVSLEAAHPKYQPIIPQEKLTAAAANPR